MVKTIPPNMSLVVGPDGKTYMRKKKRRRGPKMSKKRRAAISRGLRKFKWPIVTGGSFVINLVRAFEDAMKYGKTERRVAVGLSALQENYTGIHWRPGMAQPQFKWRSLLFGYGPLLAVAVARQLGLTRVANTLLTRLRVPARIG